MIVWSVACALGVASLLFIMRLVRGPAPADRIVAGQGVLLCVVLFLAAIANDPRWMLGATALALCGATLGVAGVKAAGGDLAEEERGDA